MLKVILLFPPSWSLSVGGPHLALPLLKTALDQNGLSVRIWDLNWEIGQFYSAHIDQADAVRAVSIGTREALDAVYFRAEDRLMNEARRFHGEWNFQIGFEFKGLSFSSSKDIRDSLDTKSPFTEYFVRYVLPRIDHEDPGLIGLSISSSQQMIPALQLCWLLRKFGYDGLIILGGNIISRLRQEIPKLQWLFDLVDGFIVFQGELPLIALAGAHCRGKKFLDVPNLIWRNGGIVNENAIMESPDPNIFPTPDFGDLPVGQYCGMNYLPVLAARGCYYGKCSFCAIPYGYGERGFGGVRDTLMVLKDIRTLERTYNFHRFKFMDEAVPPYVLRKLSASILKDKIRLEWEAFVRLERDWLDVMFVNKLGQSGFRKGSFGLEIYPSRGRNRLGKNDNANEILQLLKICYDAGIKVHLFCMFGFPGTGRPEAEKTTEFILENKHLIDTVDLNPFKYAKHTAITSIEILTRAEEDLALEYDYRPRDKKGLSFTEVEELTDEMEDIVWRECSRLLHPTYRLVSPWNFIESDMSVQEKRACFGS